MAPPFTKMPLRFLRHGLPKSISIVPLQELALVLMIYILPSPTLELYIQMFRLILQLSFLEVKNYIDTLASANYNDAR